MSQSLRAQAGHLAEKHMKIALIITNFKQGRNRAPEVTII